MVYRRNLKKIKCAGCGIEFKPIKRKQIYHNRSCYLKACIIGKRPWNKGLKGSSFNAYFAGLIDGDGSIYIYKTTPKKKNGKVYKYLGVSISIQEHDMSVLVEGQKKWGGNLSTFNGRGLGKKRVARWALPLSGTEAFLVDIFPYLRIKRKQAELAIKFCKIKRNKGRIVNNHLSDKQLSLRDDIEIKMRSLNARNVS